MREHTKIRAFEPADEVAGRSFSLQPNSLQPKLTAEMDGLRARLAEAEEALHAIRNGEVDAVLVTGKRGEQAYTLSGADSIYRQLIETMSEGAATLSADGVILYCNLRFAEMLGRPLDRVLGTALRNYLPPADQQALDATLAQAHTETSRREINLKTSEGRLVPVYLSASRLQSEEAKAVFCLVLTDLTEQKSHEQIVAAEKERSKTLLWQQGINLLQQSLLASDRLENKLTNVTDNIVRLFDADFCRIWLIRPGDLCERDCVHAEVKEGPHVCRHRDRCLHLLASSGRYTHTDGKTHRRVPFGAYKIGRIASGEDHKFVTNDVTNDPRVYNHEWARELGLVSFAGYQLRIPGGQSLGVLALFAKHPIAPTEDAMLDALSSTVSQVVRQNLAEHALQASEQKFRSLLEAVPVPVFYKDTEGRYTGMNKAFEAFCGKTRVELVGKCVFDVVPRELAEIYHAKDLELFHNRGVQIYDTQIKDAQGLMRDVVYHKATFQNSDGNVIGLICVILDITERKRAEEAREMMQAQLIQAQKLESIGTLASGVAHEINNPIMGVMNYAQLILDKLGPDSPVSEFAAEIGKEAERVATIVKNLLAFARVEKQHYSPARMRDIVEATLSLIRTVMRHDQIALAVDVPEDLPQLKCRSQQIQQVIMNLLTNARDALNEKYPGHDADKVVRIDAELGRRNAEGKWERVTGSAEGVPTSDVPNSAFRIPRSFVRLTVEDHGPGIPENLRVRIFDPFFSTKARDKGTGLGLSISHGIVKNHGGELSVESEIGQWTRFHLDLPVEEGTTFDAGEEGR